MDIERIKSIFWGNKSVKQTIAKNAFWVSVSQIASTIIRSFFILFIARLLGVFEYGRLNLAMSFAGMFAIFGDMGITNVFIRELSKDSNNEEYKKIFNVFFSYKVFLSILILLLTILASFINYQDLFLMRVIWIFGFVNLANSIAGIFSSFFGARQRMEISAVIDILGAIFSTAIGWLLVIAHPTSTVIAGGYFLGATFGCIFYFLYFQKKYFVPIIDFLSLRNELWMIKHAIPFALAGIFSGICSNVDVFVMGLFKQYDSIGLYSAAFRVMAFVGMPVGLIASSFFPTLNEMHHKKDTRMQQMLDIEIEIMIFLSFGLLFGGLPLSGRIIDFLYDPRFLGAANALRIFLFVLVFVFLYQPISQVIVIENKQYVLALAAFVNAMSNSIADVLTIPKYGHIGGAFGSLVGTFSGLFVICYFAWQSKIIKIFNISTYRSFFSAILSGLMMTVVVIFMPWPNLSVLLVIMLGGIFYILFYFLIRRLVDFGTS